MENRVVARGADHSICLEDETHNYKLGFVNEGKKNLTFRCSRALVFCVKLFFTSSSLSEHVTVSV